MDIGKVPVAPQALRDYALLGDGERSAVIWPLSLARAGYGAVLLCAPGAVISLCTGGPASPRARAVARVLGFRHLAQAAVTAGAPTPGVLTVGARVDLLHAASMLALGAANGALRRAPLSDALVAFIFAGLGAACAAAPTAAGASRGFGRTGGGQWAGLTRTAKGGIPCISDSEQS
ncbi:MAG TPA: hypothetical protein VK817_08760 [Trebonia sp.]|nr:hypothetical protein [Trebonia sp.]